MAQLRQDFSEFQNRQAEILVAGPENASVFEDYFRDNNLPFIGLPDPQHSVLKLYGQEVKYIQARADARTSNYRQKRHGPLCSLW